MLSNECMQTEKKTHTPPPPPKVWMKRHSNIIWSCAFSGRLPLNNPVYCMLTSIKFNRNNSQTFTQPRGQTTSECCKAMERSVSRELCQGTISATWHLHVCHNWKRTLSGRLVCLYNKILIRNSQGASCVYRVVNFCLHFRARIANLISMWSCGPIDATECLHNRAYERGRQANARAWFVFLKSLTSYVFPLALSLSLCLIHFTNQPKSVSAFCLYWFYFMIPLFIARFSVICLPFMVRFVLT